MLSRQLICNFAENISIENRMINVTILMPVYNGSQYLQRSIGSLIAQSYTHWELVALDDGSTDGSLSVLKQMAANDKRIKIMTKTNDGKGNTAKNISIMSTEAKGDYVFYMSQDDYLSADLLLHAVQRAEETGAEIVIPDMLLVGGDGTTEQTKGSFPPNADYSTLLRGTEAFALCIDFSIHGFALIHRRLMFASDCDTQYFDSDEYNTRVQYLHANLVAFCHGTFFYYQGNAEAMTKMFRPKQFQRLNTIVMLGERSEQENMTKEVMTRVRCWQMQVYLDVLMLLFNNAGKMSKAEYEDAVERFKNFEHSVHFKSYRRNVLNDLGIYEKVLALVYFACGTCRHLRLLHKLYKRMKH